MRSVISLNVIVLLLFCINNVCAQISVGSKNTIGVQTAADSGVTFKINSNYIMSGPRRQAFINSYSLPLGTPSNFMSNTGLVNQYSATYSHSGNGTTDTLVINTSLANSYTSNLSSTDTREHRGLSNIMMSGGTRRDIGIYNNTNVCGSSLKYGIYNYTNVCPNDTGNNTYANNNKAVFGMYNFLKVNYACAECSPIPPLRCALFSAIAPYDSTKVSSYAGYFQGNVTVVGKFTRLSDANLKTNTQVIQNGLSLIHNLTPYSYYYNNGVVGLPYGLQYGLIAQDVQSVIPAIVAESTYATSYSNNRRTDEDSGINYAEITPTDFASFKSVDYISLIPILISAIKELENTVNGLQAEVNALKATQKK